MKKAESVGHNSSLFTLGVKNPPKVLAVTNSAIKLFGPTERATLLMLKEDMQKLHHVIWDNDVKALNIQTFQLGN